MTKHKRVAVVLLSLLIATPASPGLAQTSTELKNFLRHKIGLSQDQIVAIQLGKPFAKDVQPRSPAEIFVRQRVFYPFGNYQNASPRYTMSYSW